MADEEALVDYEEDDNETDSKSDGKEIKKYVQFNIYQSKSYVDFPFLAHKITKKKQLKTQSSFPHHQKQCNMLTNFFSFICNEHTHSNHALPPSNVHHHHQQLSTEVLTLVFMLLDLKISF